VSIPGPSGEVLPAVVERLRERLGGSRGG
jgi:hypothetical protein